MYVQALNKENTRSITDIRASPTFLLASQITVGQNRTLTKPKPSSEYMVKKVVSLKASIPGQWAWGPAIVVGALQLLASLLVTTLKRPPSTPDPPSSSVVMKLTTRVPPTFTIQGAPASLPLGVVYTRRRSPQVWPSSWERTALMEKGVPFSVASKTQL